MRIAAAPLAGAARAAWERALALWGVHMHDATLLPGAGEQQGAPAWFSFPPAIVVDPAMVEALGGTADLESVFAHEIGHHVLAPSTRIDSLKIRHQLARALVASGMTEIRENDVGLLANLWNDLLVNARVALMQRRRDGAAGEPGIVRMSRLVYRAGHDTESRLWWVYLRTYELVWNLPADTLVRVTPPAAPTRVPRDTRWPDRDSPIEAVPEKFREKERALRAARDEAARIAAQLDGAITMRPQLDADRLAGLVRTFASDPVDGALRFGVLAAPYLIADEKARRGRDPRLPAAPGPGGGCAADDAPATEDELGRVLADRRLHGAVPGTGLDPADPSGVDGGGQAFGVAQTLQLYSTAEQAAVLAAWYRAEASPWVRPFTQQRASLPMPELPGPIETWETGDDLADLDWSSTLQAGPQIVPGITTRRRSYLDDEPVPRESSIELDLYIDSSGSMPHPERGSAAVLAGTILSLSVLRGGGRVRVTSFSGPGQVAGGAFTRDPTAIAADLAWFFAGGTTFPLDLLHERYAPLRPPRDDERRHLVVLSDDGLESMFGVGNDPYQTVAAQTRAKLTTASLVVMDRFHRVAAPAAQAGYDVFYVDTMGDAPAVCARLAEVLHG